MKKKNELMSFDDFIKEADKRKIVKKDVKGIDLNNPQTVMYYGSDILARVEQLRDGIYNSFNDEGNSDVQFREAMNHLKEFNDTLISEPTEKRPNKWASGICNALNKITKGRIDLLKVNENDAKIYFDYLEALKTVCDQIKCDKASLISDSETFFRIESYINMLNGYLGNVISKGEEVVEKGRQELAKTNSENVEDKMVLLEAAEKRILFLQTTQTTLNALCSEIKRKSVGKSELVTKYEEFLTVTAPTLAIYSSLAIGVKRDNQKISRMQEICDEANQMIINSSKKLTDNLGNILELGEDSLIRTKTLQEVASEFQEGVKILSDAQNQRKDTRDKVIASLNALNEIFNDYKLTLSQGTLGIESISGDSRGSMVKRKTRRKR